MEVAADQAPTELESSLALPGSALVAKAQAARVSEAFLPGNGSQADTTPAFVAGQISFD